MVVDEEQTQTIIPKDEDIEVLDAKLSFSWMVTGFKDVPIQVVSIHEVDNLPWVMGEPKCSDYKPLPEEISTKNLEFKYKDDLGNVKTDNQVPTVHSSYIIPSSSSSVISPQPTPTPPSQPRFIIIRPVNPPPIARTNAIRLTSCPTPIRFPSRDVINSVQLVSPGVRDGQNGISRDVINSVQHNSPGVRDSQNGVSSDVTNDQNSVVETGVRRLSSDTRSCRISSDVTLVPSGDDGFMEEPPSPSIFKVTKIVGSLGLDPKSAQSTSHSASHQTNAAFTQGPLIKRRRYTHTPHIAASTNNFIHSTSVTKSPHAASSMNQVSNAASTSIGSAHATSNNPQSADPDIVSISDDEEDDDLIIIS
uniref:Uncharacterized protein n=1 Tax=Cacopsylla melanoneura TaxID=428564 RepID=A0A8D9AEU5_9HEMI